MRKLGAVLTLAALFAAALSGSASAAHLQCGDVVTQSTTLDGDLGPCPGDGLLAGADGITIDLGGHVIRGSGGGTGDVVEVNGEDGVDVDHHSGVTVRNGELTNFDTAVRVWETSGARLENLSGHHNRVGAFLYEATESWVRFGTYNNNGYGVYVYESASNRVISNSMIGNTFALYAVEASDNLIWDNVGNGSGILGFQVTVASDHNSIKRNTIVGSAGVGALISGAEGNLLEDNLVQDHRLYGVLLVNAPGTTMARNVIKNVSFPQGDLSPTASAIWVTNTLGAVIDRNSLCGYPLGIRIDASQDIVERRNDVGDCGA
jgi:nitrous oxidase accessory protein NosD